MKTHTMLITAIIILILTGYNLCSVFDIPNAKKISLLALENIEALSADEDDGDCEGFTATRRDVNTDQLEYAYCDMVEDGINVYHEKKVSCDMSPKGTICCKDNGEVTLTYIKSKDKKTCSHW